MQEIISLLRNKERRIVGILCILAAVALLFYVFFARGIKGNYSRTQRELNTAQRNFQEADSLRNENKAEWLGWEQTNTDLEELRSQYFYTRETISQDLRQDVEDIFTGIGIPTPDIRYDYREDTKEKIAKVNATFQISGPYHLMKRFVYSVENFSKFLIVEKIDFADINMQSGGLKLKIVLAGYYED